MNRIKLSLAVLSVFALAALAPRANAQTYLGSWTGNGVTFSAELTLTSNFLNVKNTSSTGVNLTGIYLNAGDSLTSTWTVNKVSGGVTGYTGNGNETKVVNYNWLLTGAANPTASVGYTGVLHTSGVNPFAFQFTSGSDVKTVVLDTPTPEPALYQLAAFMVLGTMGMIRKRKQTRQ